MRTGREHAANWTQTRYKEHITLFFKHDSSHRKVGFFYRKMNDHLGIQISVHYVLTKDKNLSATEREIKKKKKKFAKQPKQRDTSESYRSNNDGDLQID